MNVAAMLSSPPDPADALESALLPLFVYCERALSRPDVSDWTLGHVHHLEVLFAAVEAYDTAVKVELSAQARAAEQLRRRYNPFERPPTPFSGYRAAPPDSWPDGIIPPGLDAASLLTNIPKMACYQNGLTRLAASFNG